MTAKENDSNITNNNAVGKGTELKTMNRIFLVLVVLISVILIITSVIIFRADKEVEEATVYYIDSQKSEVNMQLGSDYLTEQARLFVVTGDEECMDNYFKEANITKRRDKSLEDIRKASGDTIAFDYLQSAMVESLSLMKIEYRAMKLMAESKHMDEAEMPEEVRTYALSKEDEALSDSQKAARAEKLMFDRHYRNYKEAITRGVNKSLGTILKQTEARMNESAEDLTKAFRLQLIFIVVLIALCFVMVFFYTRNVIRPMMKGIRHIEQNEHIPVKGARELRYLADSYNVVLDETNRNKEKLSYEASHDALTGVYNRKVFESSQNIYNKDDICMMLVDVDNFKSINDNYGHKTGDRVLCRVADLFFNSFRSEDQICRIGGDEFAVIMIHANSSMEDLVRGKLEEIRRQLQEPEDDLPPVTLSIGIAFSDRKDPEGDIYNDADKMLYKVKERGRNGFEFY